MLIIWIKELDAFYLLLINNKILFYDTFVYHTPFDVCSNYIRPLFLALFNASFN